MNTINKRHACRTSPRGLLPWTQLWRLCLLGLLLCGAMPRGFAQDNDAHQAVSLQFQKLDVRSALQALATQAGLNLVMSDAVKGQVSLSLHEVPWRVALDALLTAKQLGVQQREGIWWVAPLSELAGQEKRDWERRQALDALEPLMTRAFVLRFARAPEVHAQLLGQTPANTAWSPAPALGMSGALPPGPGTPAMVMPPAGLGLPAFPGASQAGAPGSGSAASPSSNRMLSTRGSVMSEPRTNQLFVTDIASRLQAVADLIQRIDIPQRQVMIEARVVEASTSFGESLGASLTVGESGDGTGGVNFPAASLNGQLPARAVISVFSPSQQRRIAAALTALQTSGEGEVLSHPRVVTADQVQAVIEQGTELPYQVSATHGGTSIAFRKANLRLEVTPQITDDQTVILHVNLSKDSVGQLTPAGYAIDTKHLSTQVRISDGGTVMVGGILERNQQDAKAGVPKLASWPVVGWLFGNRAQQNSRRELLVFITPKILDERDVSP